jgi:hypothetical protein
MREKAGILEARMCPTKSSHCIWFSSKSSRPTFTQVQQVFINKAYNLLRKHSDPASAIPIAPSCWSAHSGHVAHEADSGNPLFSAQTGRIQGRNTNHDGR